MSQPGPALTNEQLDRLCESLRVNPSWEAAADYAGTSSRTLRTYRNRAEQYANRLNQEEEPTDISARRAYREARDEWANPATRGAALARLARLDAYLDRDADRAYWLAVERMNVARSRLEMSLSAEMYRIATRAEKDSDRVKALALLMRWGWPKRYAERLEVTGAEGGALEVQLADAELRAQAAYESTFPARAFHA